MRNYGGNLFFNTHGNDGNNDNNVSTKMSILHNGNVGIGTDTPTSSLHIKSTQGYSSHFYHGNNLDTYIRGGKDSGNIYLNGDTGGNVGIGTLTPDYKLDVRGNMRLGNGSTAQQALRFRSSDGDWQIGSNNYGNGTNDNQLFFYNVDDGQVRMCIQRGSGNVGIGMTSTYVKTTTQQWRIYIIE